MQNSSKCYTQKYKGRSDCAIISATLPHFNRQLGSHPASSGSKANRQLDETWIECIALKRLPPSSTPAYCTYSAIWLFKFNKYIAYVTVDLCPSLHLSSKCSRYIPQALGYRLSFRKKPSMGNFMPYLCGSNGN